MAYPLFKGHMCGFTFCPGHKMKILKRNTCLCGPALPFNIIWSMEIRGAGQGRAPIDGRRAGEEQFSCN